MPPTVQSASKERDRKRPGDKRSELVCTVKYNNTLPDIPFDPKFITYPFESTRFIQYKPTSLERTFKYDLLTEHDLGVTIDLINPDTYKINTNALLEPEDEKLLDEESTSFSDQKRSRHNKMNVSWLRKTEYISTEYNRFAQKADKSETKVGYNIKKGISEDYFYKDRESQITAIEKTFEKAKENIGKHYSKPGVQPVEVLPVFPDFELWKHPFAQVIFDSDPAPKGRSGPALMEEMSQAMIRGAVDESGEQFVAYFLPTEETRQKRKRDEMEEEAEPKEDDDEYDYLLAREYNWTVKNKLTKGYEETYFMVFREDGCYYDELETRVRLSKRRKGAGTAVVKSRLVVKHRDFSEKEIRAQDVRMLMLAPPQDEEDEEEEEEEDEFPQNTNNDEEFQSLKGSDNEDEDRRSRSRSRSRSSSRSRSRSGSKASSASRSRSRSRSRSKSGSRSRSGSQSRSRSRSRSKSRSRSRSRSGSRSKSRSKSRSRSRSRTPSRSRSRSRSRSKSGSVRSRSRSRSGSRNLSRSRSRSRSRSKSGSRSPSRSRSRSRSRSKSVSRSRSASEAESGSEAEDRGKKDEEEIFGSASDSDSD